VNTMLLVLGLLSPRDTVIVELYLVPTAERITVEAVQEGAALFLPAGPIHDLLGITMPGPWVALEDLRHAYPTVVFAWQPEQLRVAVFDELGVLPAVKRFHEQHRASALGTIGIPAYSGPWAAAAVDDHRRAILEGGYWWRGRFALAARVDDRGTNQWTVSASPTSRLFVSAIGGSRQRPQISGRIQTGPLWLYTNYVPHRPLEVAGLVQGGPVQVFASQQYGVITISPMSQVSVQLAQTWRMDRTAFRVAVGPTYASPFTFPVTQLSH
jgi:hypothetical protein